MSTCANIFVLFKAAPADMRVAEIEEAISNRTGLPVEPKGEIYNRLIAVEDSHALVDISEDGIFHYHDSWSATSSAVPRLDGRVFRISYSARWWDKAYPEGPVITYALTMLWLMSQVDVVDVWYMSDGYSEGGRYQRMSQAQVHEMIDDFVAIGDTTSGRPTRYIRAEDGTIISV
jgi:hypothetical protein